MNGIEDLFTIDGKDIFMCKDDSSVIYLRFPQETIPKFELAPLDYSRIVGLKKSLIQRLKFNDHDISLEHWDILEGVEMG